MNSGVQRTAAHLLTRRAMLTATAAAALMPGLAQAGPGHVDRQAALNAARLRPDTLAYSAAKSRLLFGSFLAPSWLADAAYMRATARECSLVYAYGMSPPVTRKVSSGFDFGIADSLVAFANANALAVAGGYLVEHSTAPPWITPATERAAALAELQTIVATTMTHFAGQLDHWIVVNEAFNVPAGNPYGLRDCTWRSTIGGDVGAGTDYISQAFTAARRADPKAVLVLGEYGIEADHPDDERKRAAVLAVLRALRRNNVPIDALGMQAHLHGERRATAGALDGFLNSVHDLGLKIAVMELDAIDANLPPEIGPRDGAVARAMGDFLNVVLRHPVVTSINVWGLSDTYSWYNRKTTSALVRRKDGLASRGTVLDDHLARKPAYFAIRDALDAAARRG